METEIFPFLTVIVFQLEGRWLGAPTRTPEGKEEVIMAQKPCGHPAPVLELMRRAHRDLWRHSLAVARLAGRAALILPDGGGAPRAALLTGALLHDVGKALWPDELFAKRLLSDADWRLIRAYPTIGCNLVREKWPGAPEHVIRIVLEHHRRPGGRGYPNGVNPSRPALLVAACDTVAAMTADRGYRPAAPLERALEEVSRWAPADVAAAVEAAAIEMELEELWLGEAREERKEGKATRR